MPHRVITGVAAVCALAGSCLAVTGPDITHQDIQDAIKYPTTGGPINNRYGYAWGSYTCNLGDTALAWINGGTPALAMNAYRLHNGRLTQIGLGNAKHGCCVGNSSGCGTCSGTGTGLRAGCRDIYSASFNSGQTRLGPRSGINPYAGTFSSIAQVSGDVIFRRVQVTVDDMNATTYPGAQYFAEGVYVCTGELPAQQLNNATYRPMAVANAGAAPTYNWTVTGTSSSGKPAIYAWKEHGLGLNLPDPDVTIANLDVPEEGRFVVGAKVIDLGGGQWRYEYAVFNLNSHRSGSGFRVPVHPSVTVTAAGFSAPDYHSGEIYNNADWIQSRCSSSVVWKSPQTFAENPNTNALRWGTMYNFWFTANTPPSTGGTLQLDLFRPDAINSVTLASMPVPQQNTCNADFNGIGGVSTQDMFDYVAAWFSADPRADLNCNGSVTVQDVFDFVSVWFTGCA